MTNSDFDVLLDPEAFTGDRQVALAALLVRCLQSGMSPGEMRTAIRRAGQTVGNQDVLNYEHPLFPDPVVSCASKEQLLINLQVRFGMNI